MYVRGCGLFIEVLGETVANVFQEGRWGWEKLSFDLPKEVFGENPSCSYANVW